MNWTGGRLKRHSNQRNTQLSNGKQKFPKPKSRFKARASPPELSLFTANTQHILRHEDTREEPNRIPIAPPCSTTLSPIKTTTHTDLLKRQLLQKSDWAAVSAARPLQISFAPVEETGRFGKRRRLTDSDRKRLSSHQPRPGVTQIAWKCQHKGDLSEVGTIDKLDIRINGQRPNAGRMSSQLADKGLTSSQPMLLDSEPLDTPLRDDSNKRLWEDRLLSPFPDQESIHCDSLSLYSTSQRYTSPPIEEQPLPPKRHFTLDDQLIAEQEGRLSIPYHPPNGVLHRVDNYQHSPPHKKEPNRQDQATGDPQSSPGNHWLPSPRYTIQRALCSRPPRPTRSTPSTSRSTLHDPALQANPTPTTNHQVSPLTIYGQPVDSFDQVTARTVPRPPWSLNSPDLDPRDDTAKDYPSISIPSTGSIPRASSPQPADRLGPFFLPQRYTHKHTSPRFTTRLTQDYHYHHRQQQ